MKIYKEEHQKFKDILESGELTLYKVITSFLLDPNTNYNDEDDQEFFRELLFGSKASQHIPYMNDLLSNIGTHSNLEIFHIKALSKLSHFYFTLNVPFFQQDLLHYLIETDSVELIEQYFSYLIPAVKINTIEYLINFCPKIFQHSQKFRVYRVFS